MKAINSSYALYFNTRHDRVGHLFQGRFKSEPVETDTYFLTVLRYIHQNPVKAGISPACDYPWSSYREYFGKRGVADTSFALEMLGGHNEFRRFHDNLDLTAACCDVGRSRRLVDEDEARDVALVALGGIDPNSVSGLDRAERNAAIHKLREHHLSIRQIERLTGVSRGVIANVAKS